MPTSKTDGSQSATGGEDTLATINDAGTYILKVNMKNMLAGDKTIIRVKDQIEAMEMGEQ